MTSFACLRLKLTLSVRAKLVLQNNVAYHRKNIKINPSDELNAILWIEEGTTSICY